MSEKTQGNRPDRVYDVGVEIALVMTKARLTPDEMKEVLVRQTIAWAGIGMEDIPKVKANLTSFLARIEELFTRVSAVGMDHLKVMRDQFMMARDGSWTFLGILDGWSPPEGTAPPQLIIRLDDGDEILIDQKMIVFPEPPWTELNEKGRRVRVDCGEGHVRVTVLS